MQASKKDGAAAGGADGAENAAPPQQWNLIIDVARCENCNNCVLANKDEYVGNDFPGYTAAQELHGAGTMRIHRQVRGEGHLVDAAYLPTMCNHCDDAPCIKAAGADVIAKREDGIVIIDPLKARGRKDLVDACPYGAIVWNEKAQLPQQWIFDAHLLDKGWKEPRCAQSCPTDAIQAIKTDAAGMEKLATERKLEVLKPELNTKPRIYYANLYRYSKHFVAGSVVAKIEGRLECVQGAEVRLQAGDMLLQRVLSDTFGDFKFDGLDGNASTRVAGEGAAAPAVATGGYTVQVSHDTLGAVSIDVLAGRTQVLGDIELRHIAGA